MRRRARLVGRPTIAGLDTGDGGTGGFELERGFEATLGYGLLGLRGRGVVTPYAGLGLASEGTRT